MKLLIAIDGSEQALRATRRAMALTQECRTPPALTLISVHDDSALHHASHFVGQKVVIEHLHAQSEIDLAPALALCREAGIEPEQIVRIGHVAQEIATTAASGAFDMIVLGTKGRSRMADLLIGSVAQRVCAISSIPVLLVP